MTLKDKKEESNGFVSTESTESLIQDLRQIINSLRFSLTFKLSRHWRENCLGFYPFNWKTSSKYKRAFFTR